MKADLLAKGGGMNPTLLDIYGILQRRGRVFKKLQLGLFLRPAEEMVPHRFARCSAVRLCVCQVSC